MLNHPTHEHLTQLRLFGMARALAEQASLPDIGSLSFEERLGLLVDRERAERQNRLAASRLRRARLKQPAVAEDIDYRHPRGLDRAVFRRLLTGDWVNAHQNVLITGPTGVGKTYLACALANAVCRQGQTALYQRLPRLFEELAVARGDGRYARLMTSLAKVDVLILDDWGLALLDDERRRDLLECSMNGIKPDQRSSPASCRSPPSTIPWAIPLWPTPSWIVWCITRTPSIWMENPCADSSQN